ncbi:hypothetical protein EPO34_01905 [Patescibacteria group bacterium]|nr:MAG: hypothetical protein EPO34_01905 [Patescibacteria group bacterium]
MAPKESYLKAGTYADPSPSPSAPRLTLTPLHGRDGFAFALCVTATKRPSPDANLACRLVEEHLDRLAASFGMGDHPQHSFEAFLGAMNAAISELVRTTEWTLPIRDFRALVGIACGSEMYLSGTGDLTAMFLHRTQDNRYQAFNLTRSIQTEQALPTWEKPFAVVLDGELRPGDVFCLSSKELAPAIGNDELCGVLSSLPPIGAAARIRQYFAFNDVLSILVLRAQAEEAAPAVEQAKPRSEVSLDRLVESRERTDRLIEDQAPRGSALFALARRLLRPRAPEEPGMPRPAGWLRRAARSASRAALSLVGHTAANAPRGDARARIVREPKERMGERVSGLVLRLRDLPRTSRRLAIAAFCVLAALSISLAALSRTQARREVQEAFNERMRAVEELRDQAAAAAIYRDEDRARLLYGEALADLRELALDTPERREAGRRIEQDVTAALDRLRRVVRLPDPPRIASALDARAVVGDGTHLYLFGADKGILRVNPSSGAAEPLPVPASAVGVALKASVEDATVAFLDDRPGVSELVLSDAQMKVTSLAPAADAAWKDLTAYGGRLYVLSVSLGDAQVLKFPSTTSGFGQPSGWIRSKTSSLADARGLAVDGYVYVLTGSDLLRFVNGGESGWDLRGAEPAMADAQDVWTSFESERLYVLEPSQRRVLVFAKEDGTLLAQYVADAFAQSRDLFVDEKEGTIYVLTGDALYGFRPTAQP